MQTHEFLKFKYDCKVQISQGASTSDIMLMISRAFDMGELEGLRQIETKLSEKDLEAFQAALDGDVPEIAYGIHGVRKSEIDEVALKTTKKMYASLVVRRGNFGSINLYERYYPGPDRPDYTILVNHLNPTEVKYCHQRGVQIDTNVPV